jgi:hypothetical protein
MRMINGLIFGATRNSSPEKPIDHSQVTPRFTQFTTGCGKLLARENTKKNSGWS